MRHAIVAMAWGLTCALATTRAEDAGQAWTFSGRTQADAVDVRSRTSGHLLRLAVAEGDAFRKGDLLAELDPQSCRLDLRAAEARRRAAEAQLQASAIKLANSERLVQNKVVSQDELSLSRAANVEAEAALAVADVEVERAGLALSGTRIEAPFDGRVGRILAVEGAPVGADRTPVMRVVADGPLRVSFEVPEAVLLQLRRGGLAEPRKLKVDVGLAGEDGHPHPAELDQIGLEVDPTAGTVRFRATMANPKGLLMPGLLCRVRLAPKVE